MKTLVLGASPNPARYAYLATQRLVDRGHEVVLVGGRAGEIEGLPIQTTPYEGDDVDTVTLYLGPARQAPYYRYLTEELRPRRIIFNPGTENPELVSLAQEAGIETEVACTLVMLSAGTY